MADADAGARALLVAGKKTSADTLLELAGAQNAVQSFQGFKPLTAEAVVQAAPEVVLIPDEGAHSLGGTQGVLSLPGLSLTPAGKQGNVLTMDGSLLLGFGPRLGAAVLELKQRLRSFDKAAGSPPAPVTSTPPRAPAP